MGRSSWRRWPRTWRSVLTADESEVHVWIAELSEPRPAAEAVLDREELERAGRFRFEADRRRYCAAHAALREILAGYLGCQARAIRIERDPGGKPRTAGVEFSLSHSGELALVAVARGTAVGVDIERIRGLPDAAAIAGRFFPPEEAAEVRASPESFFRLWTRREAWLKAEGIGLAGIGREQPAGWTVLDLSPAPGYAAAVAFQGRRRAVLRRFTAAG